MKIALIILVVVILGGAIFWFNKEPAIAPNGSTVSPLATSPTVSPALTATVIPSVGPLTSPTVTPQTTKIPTITPTPFPTPSAKTYLITFQNGSASPLNVEIKVGDMVKFVNNDDAQRWPASGVHPTHQICPGFDSLHGLNKGESYSFTFNESKTCPWHDHLNPSIKGQIVVNP